MKRADVKIVMLEGGNVEALYIDGVYHSEAPILAATDVLRAVGLDIQVYNMSDDGLTNEGKFPAHFRRINDKAIVQI